MIPYEAYLTGTLIRIDGPPGRPGSGCVNFIALTAVLRREFHYTPFRAKDMKIMANAAVLIRKVFII